MKKGCFIIDAQRFADNDLGMPVRRVQGQIGEFPQHGTASKFTSRGLTVFRFPFGRRAADNGLHLLELQFDDGPKVQLHLKIHGIHIDFTKRIAGVSPLTNHGGRAPDKNTYAEHRTDDTGQKIMPGVFLHIKCPLNSRDPFRQNLPEESEKAS